ncbi:MAG: YidC/Oxa1 family membrane protein insertase [bacterium]|nr:YidC/Oxa1 family membrane protein insertase [bacterium]
MIEIASLAYNELLYRPVYNLVVIIYNVTPGPNFGWTMIGLAILIRFLFIIFTLRGLRTDEIIKQVEPQIKEIEKDTYLSSQEQRAKIMDLLRSKGINPYTEIYSIVAQVGFLAVNYQVIQYGLKPSGFHNLYSFVHHPESINSVFFGFDLVRSSLVLSAFAALLLFVEQVWEYAEKKEIPTAFSERWFPLLLASGTFILLYILPSAKAVFIATSVLFSLALKTTVRLARRS